MEYVDCRHYGCLCSYGGYGLGMGIDMNIKIVE